MNLKKIEKSIKAYDYVLVIMRHAKTEPFHAEGDFERVLTEKGLKQAKAVAKGLRAMDLVPDQIDCSSAVRARQTCERMLKTFGDKPKVNWHKSLYGEGMQAIFDQLQGCKTKRHELMVISHEPTVSMACQWLANPSSDPHLLGLLNLGLSTATCVIFGANVPFNAWDIHQAQLLAVLGPKDF
ncbi:phosphoglycerate mutase [Bifidobacterium dolichotidis]|uniref:Phosphoglycerate mutase n=1 Tax=Bifidobacterium dolichotidis TaxID=2306976 RepID=A0A430FT50_9BIFI|nr:histidine phosphatase family protein [Bifidobacterium dolichotidis]RSX55997.1 phosphoglycerate mutase [Bifidobacterium dolichotidis]